MATNYNSSYDIIRSFINSKFTGANWDALISGLSAADELNAKNILALKDNIRIMTASERYLDVLMSNIGIERPPGIGISDNAHRDLGIKQTNSKVVNNIFLDILETYYGIDATHAWIISPMPEMYRLSDGMTLKILVDSNTKPLTIVFSSSMFNNINEATALEVSGIITNQSFNSGYSMYADVFKDQVTGNSYIKLISATKGIKSSITVIGGEAQNVFKFNELRPTTQIGGVPAQVLVNETISAISPPFPPVLQNVNTSTGSQGFGAFVSSIYEVAQSFSVPTSASILELHMWLSTNSGIPFSTCVMDLATDSSGAPGIVVATSSNAIDVSSFLTPTECAFNFNYVPTPGVTYWAILRPTMVGVGFLAIQGASNSVGANVALTSIGGPPWGTSFLSSTYLHMAIYVEGSLAVNQVQSPIAANTPFDLPYLTSFPFTQVSYVVGGGNLNIYYNGTLLTYATDWTEIGVPGSSSTQVFIDRNISGGDTVRFEILSIGYSPTQFTTSFSGNNIRYTWSGGSNPGLVNINEGDYVNIFGGSISPENTGSFAILKSSDKYFEIENPLFSEQGVITLDCIPGNSYGGTVNGVGISQIVRDTSTGLVTVTTSSAHGLSSGDTGIVSNVLDSSFNGTFTVPQGGVISSTQFEYSQVYETNIKFFMPVKNTLQKGVRYSAIFEVNPYEVVAFLPATADIIERGLIGAWHLNPSPYNSLFPGSYICSNDSKYSLKEQSAYLSESINSGDARTIISGSNFSQFPDSTGYVVFGFGTDNEEGPVRYYSRPSDSTLFLDETYKFKNIHNIGEEISLVFQRGAYQPKIDGSDYQPYLTGTSQGRVQAEKLINKIAAAGIKVNIIIVYPGDKGLADVVEVFS